MSGKILLPKFSATMEEGEVVKWLKKTGDVVALGDALVEIETDKTMLEIEATVNGTLGELLVKEGETADVGDVLAYVFEEGEAPEPAEPTSKKTVAVGPEVDDSPDNQHKKNDAVAPELVKVKASPAAKRMAREYQIDIALLTGTGPGGRILEGDVADAAEKKSSNAPPAAAPSLNDVVRRRIAAQVSESRRTIPSFTLERWVDLSHLLSGERKICSNGVKITISDYLLHSLSAVLENHPTISGVWDQDQGKATRLDNPGIGLVVGLENGLVIPVLKNLQGLSLEDVAMLRNDAVLMARSNRLSDKFVGGAAITISNLSRGGADRFEAIINPGESSILAIGRIHERVVPRDGVIAISTGCFITLSVDHRVIDGLVGASFLKDLVEHLENRID